MFEKWNNQTYIGFKKWILVFYGFNKMNPGQFSNQIMWVFKIGAPYF